MKFLKNLKMSVKLGGGFAVVLVLLLVVMSIYSGAISSTVNIFKELMDINVALATHASKTETLMMKCRLNEKDFLLHLDKKYLNELEESLKALKSEAETVLSVGQSSGNESFAVMAQNIMEYIQTYEKSFKDLGQAYEKRGLDAKSGLRAKLDKAAAELSDVVSQFQVESVYIDNLKLLKYENEYTRVPDSDGKEKLDEHIKAFLASLPNSKANEIIIDSLSDNLATYSELLNKLDKAINSGASAATIGSIQEELRSTSGDIEMFLTAAYLPGCETLLLAVRSNEKDYLLFGNKKFVKSTHAAVEKFSKAANNSSIDEDFISEVNVAIAK